ncbi:MAG: hypothetical protein RMK91_08920 [Pseudanabaenaceae cyanobacterium SKYGB_i_bin29]|nr:hypothetical protein [Pseudanabaenaceae cyanobacterium SKYG29]MDW8421978.1 hypothetical protein [Pseudanabaenaceae cyanobacterium SKYGB_i_bin29]
MKRLGWLIPLLVVTIGGTVTVNLQRQNLSRITLGQTPESDRVWIEREYRNLKAMQKLPPGGFGFNNIIADWYFLSFLQYYGDDVARDAHQTGYGLSKEYFRIITARKPYMFASYSYLVSSISIHGGEPEVTVQLLESALTQLQPEQFYLTYIVWNQKGIEEFLFLGDNKRAQKSYRKAIEALDRATFPPSLREQQAELRSIFAKRIEFLQQRYNRKSLQRMGWFLVLQNAPDLKTRKVAVAKLQELGVPIEIDAEGEIKFNPPHKN